MPDQAEQVAPSTQEGATPGFSQEHIAFLDQRAGEDRVQAMRQQANHDRLAREMEEQERLRAIERREPRTRAIERLREILSPADFRRFHIEKSSIFIQGQYGTTWSVQPGGIHGNTHQVCGKCHRMLIGYCFAPRNVRPTAGNDFYESRWAGQILAIRHRTRDVIEVGGSMSFYRCTAHNEVPLLPPKTYHWYASYGVQPHPVAQQWREEEMAALRR